ncbi:cytochrome P450 [Streptomyces griseorubiginosus]|uniref:cytochrome P450 n=1 Tax=Streptomyces griseorubiginosus TaxID=67304 RepID=UPI000B26C4EE|nr:cytochrome P450 [Streptomyces griseorubiginosus]
MNTLPPPGCPAHSQLGHEPLHIPEFAADPHRHYARMRARHGSLVPVELAPGVPATLVIGYYTAIRILNDPDRFPADPRRWQKNAPQDSPILPMLQWRPNALRSAGAEHARHRAVCSDSLEAVDLHALDRITQRLALELINDFCTAGKADLISQYAMPLAFQVLSSLLGCPPEIGQRIAQAIAMIFDGTEAERGNTMLGLAMEDLLSLKRQNPDDDITSRILAHPASENGRELIEQVILFFGSGTEPEQNLIVNTLLLMLSDERFSGDLLGGSLTVSDAIDEVLFNDPPLANFCVSYPREPVLVEGKWLPADQPVVISLTACNNDPAIAAEHHPGNRSHLAWGAGPHACPGQPTARVITEAAITQILDALPEMRLETPAEDLTWRPGPFHRALSALPVVFPPSPPLPLP